MAMTRVWNLSDSPNNSARPTTVMVLGRSLKPGRSLPVDEEALKRAHKLHAEVARGIAFIGKKPPQSYLDRRKPPRALLGKDVARTHGMITKTEAKLVVNVVDEVKVEDTFDIVMTGDGGDDKIKVIREFREATGIDVKDAADAVNSKGVRSIGTGLTKVAADELSKRLKDVGAEVEVLTTSEAAAKIKGAEEASEGSSKSRRRRHR